VDPLHGEPVSGCVGHGVLAAKDGQEGLRQSREAGPALVITEISMPSGDGLDTIRGIRGEAAPSPFRLAI
jgi:DNA-binding NarL/FixJ family response regulator